jgi:hypothetical protein
MQVFPTFRRRVNDRRLSPVALATALLLIALAAASLVASADAKRRGKPVDTTIASTSTQDRRAAASP